MHTTDSLRRSLIHHGATFQHASAGRWVIETGAGQRIMSDREVYAYVEGLDDRERIDRPFQGRQRTRSTTSKASRSAAARKGWATRRQNERKR